MARCPFCNAILEDAWIKKQGASVMGRQGGRAKARTTASLAARARWDKERKNNKKKFKEK